MILQQSTLQLAYYALWIENRKAHDNWQAAAGNDRTEAIANVVETAVAMREVWQALDHEHRIETRTTIRQSWGPNWQPLDIVEGGEQ